MDKVQQQTKPAWIKPELQEMPQLETTFGADSNVEGTTSGS